MMYVSPMWYVVKKTMGHLALGDDDWPTDWTWCSSISLEGSIAIGYQQIRFDHKK
jgi:hypothetical protein